MGLDQYPNIRKKRIHRSINFFFFQLGQKKKISGYLVFFTLPLVDTLQSETFRLRGVFFFQFESSLIKKKNMNKVRIDGGDKHEKEKNRINSPVS